MRSSGRLEEEIAEDGKGSEKSREARGAGPFLTLMELKVATVWTIRRADCREGSREEANQVPARPERDLSHTHTSHLDGTLAWFQAWL